MSYVTTDYRRISRPDILGYNLGAHLLLIGTTITIENRTVMYKGNRRLGLSGASARHVGTLGIMAFLGAHIDRPSSNKGGRV